MPQGIIILFMTHIQFGKFIKHFLKPVHVWTSSNRPWNGKMNLNMSIFINIFLIIFSDSATHQTKLKWANYLNWPCIFRPHCSTNALISDKGKLLLQVVPTITTHINTASSWDEMIYRLIYKYRYIFRWTHPDVVHYTERVKSEQRSVLKANIWYLKETFHSFCEAPCFTNITPTTDLLPMVWITPPHFLPVWAICTCNTSHSE